jgi:hypothetical protein
MEARLFPLLQLVIGSRSHPRRLSADARRSAYLRRRPSSWTDGQGSRRLSAIALRDVLWDAADCSFNASNRKSDIVLGPIGLVLS